MEKNSGLFYGTFHKDKLIKIKNNLPKHSLSDFNIGSIVTLRSGGPDMWILAVHGNGEIECGWIKSSKSYSETFLYQCLFIKEK